MHTGWRTDRNLLIGQPRGTTACAEGFVSSTLVSRPLRGFLRDLDILKNGTVTLQLDNGEEQLNAAIAAAVLKI